jgi:tripartite-type tricarboxylate transporter receptor subunit TctC
MNKKLAPLLVSTMLPVWLLHAPCSHAQAPAWPTKPVRLVVSSSAGGPYDDVARALGPRLTEIWGQTVVVENRAGAGGTIGATFVARSAPDGYTMMLGNAGPMAINPLLQKKLPYDPQKDFAPVTLIMSAPMVLVVHPSMPVKSVREMVVLAKARPGRLNYASAGVGNLQHLSMELLMSMAQIKMNHVPYKGAAPALVDLIAGQVDLMFANIVGALPHVKAERLRAIAVSSAKRSGLLPAVPAVADTYPQFDVTAWMGLFMPAGTPRELVSRIGSDFIQVVKRPDMRERLANQGAEAIAGSPEQLAELMRRESAVYAKVIKEVGITPE